MSFDILSLLFSVLVIECLINPRRNNYEVLGATLQGEVTLISSKYYLAN